MRKSIAIAGTVLVLLGCGEPPVDQEPSSAAGEEQVSSGDESLPEPRPDIVEDRFALLALSCIHRAYPNKISHVLNSDADVQSPQDLTPAFYGCFDWHSAVHGHWLLARLARLDEASPFQEPIREALSRSLTAENIAQEVAYYSGPDRASFERPYGIAWYLQLVAELEESNDPQFSEWRETLAPLEQRIVANVKDWLPKLAYPIRLGTHNQSAFAFGMMIDYARVVGDEELERMLIDKSLEFHRNDVNCPLAYEPSGEDFLSPCLMEADLMRRVMSQADFAEWLGAFLPDLPEDGSGDWLAPGVVIDPSDGKLVHLDGLNLSRAWALEGIAQALPEEDPRRAGLQAASDIHRETGIASISDEHYSGSHWLASFATYLTTQRGLR